MSAPENPTDHTRAGIVLTSKDPSFSALFEHLCQESPFRFITNAGPAITLETVRTHSPEAVLIDTDSVDLSEVGRLVLKLTLVTHAKLILTGADLTPGYSGLDPLVLAGAHGVVSKPGGKTSLSLTGESGTQYLAELERLVPNPTQRRTP